jgi:hypothetical protein
MLGDQWLGKNGSWGRSCIAMLTCQAVSTEHNLQMTVSSVASWPHGELQTLVEFGCDEKVNDQGWRQDQVLVVIVELKSFFQLGMLKWHIHLLECWNLKLVAQLANFSSCMSS